MPKLKTNKGAAKRFRITKKGKVKRGRAFAGHLLSCKKRKRKRRLRQASFVSGSDSKRISHLFPYGSR